LATIGGARALGLDDRIGTLEAGKDADLAVFPLPVDRTANRDDALDLALSVAGTLPVLVTVKGRELVRDGRVVGLDAALAGRVQSTVAALVAWRRGLPSD
jgi:5-methylthioadenosine/S-adenosylhomocysteine deaminase